MTKALYRKYRSKNLSEVIGQEHITDTLSHALKLGMISHAYLLTGPRGIGKTSVARILAYEVNNLPYDEESTHMDIIEIDAASNRRIDEIRDLKERVFIAPSSAKYKVYIIDEVHMLTKEAFNALLKTLEEPPEHAIFILATTEAHKVPETIISRTQRFTFKPVDTNKVVDHLKTIAKLENIKISDDALKLIAQHGEGSFRDSISLLDQVRHTSKSISLEDVQLALGHAPEAVLVQLLNAVLTHDIQSVAASLAELQEQGVQPAKTAKQLSKIVRNAVINQDTTFQPDNALKLLKELLRVPAEHDPSSALEIVLYSHALKDGVVTNKKTVSSLTAAPSVQAIPKTSKQKIPSQPAAISPEPDITVETPTARRSLDDASWDEVLSAIRNKHNTIYSIARMAKPRFEPGKLTLIFNFGFHQKRLSDTKNKQLLLEVVQNVVGEPIEIECTVDSNSKAEKLASTKPIKSKPNSSGVDLETISNIFGGAEIVD